jgi:two-component system response regulator HydG
MSRILVIDDDSDINALLKRFLTKHGYEVETTFSGAEGQKLVESFKPDLIMSDYRLDDIDGATLLTRIKEKNPEIPFIIITGYSDLRTAVKVVRLGAFDYVTKPLIPDEILLTIKKALSQKSEEGEEGSSQPAQKVKAAKSQGASPYLFSSSLQSQNLEHQIDLVAPTNYSVILYGESGSGKEGVARMIHEKSKRREKPFVAMDCGAISKELAGSELFGYEKGAFTGAMNQKIGHFEMANGGTLFLDEVANLPYEIQTLLLRVLQEKVLRRLGSTRETEVDVRIIVASNERLTESIRQGKFREDLYHRLNEFSIEVPSLRNRKPDIIFFATHFLREAAAELQKNLTGFEPEVERVFLSYPWFGNVRELKNVIKRAALLTDSSKVDIKSLPFEILNHARLEFDPPESHEDVMGEIKTEQPLNAGVLSEPEPSKPRLKKAAMEAEYEMILVALNKVNFNKKKAAQILGIDRKTLYNKMKKMNLKDQ